MIFSKNNHKTSSAFGKRWRFPIGLVAALFVLFLFASPPTASTTSMGKKSPGKQSAARVELEALSSRVKAYDDIFLAGRPETALAGYEAIRLEKPRYLFGTIHCRIAACYDALGRYADAMASYRRAEAMGGSWVLDGMVKSKMAHLAHRYGDAEGLAAILAETRAQWIDGPLGFDPRSAFPSDNPGWSENKNAQAYLFFGRNLALTFDRAGSDFAYARALELSDREPSISVEYALQLGFLLYDGEAELAVLRGAKPTTDPELLRYISSELNDRSSYWEHALTPQQKVKARADSKARLEKERQGFFNFMGIY